MSLATAEADTAAAAIGAGSWAAGAVGGAGGPDLCSGVPGFPGPLSPLVQPIEDVLDLVLIDPATVYHASQGYDDLAAVTANARDLLASVARAVDEALSGLASDALVAAVKTVSAAADSASDWTKVMGQALQLAVTILEAIRSLACEALLLLSRFADTVVDVVFGGWPWELSKKAEAIHEFTREVERFVDALSDAVDRAMKALRELIRLVLDLYRAIIPFHESIDSAIGGLVSLVPGGNPPPVGPGRHTGPGGAVYNPGTSPIPGSDLTFSEDYPLGYSHTYDLGATDLTTAELNQLFRDDFGNLFVPGRVGDNSQLDMQLTGVGQTIETSLFGTAIPGATTGTIHVAQMTEDGFVIQADANHPEAPGEVAFQIVNVDGRAQLTVAGGYDETIFGRHDGGLPIDSNPAYAAVADVSIWSDMQGRIQDRLRYGG